jgi:hypothetical protein
MIKELIDWWNNAPPKPMPNCQICKWVEVGLAGKFCGAQGGHSCISVYNTRMCKKLFEEEDNTVYQRVKKAITIAFQYGSIDGAHHKMWVIDQIVRTLLAEEYDTVVEEYKNCEDGPYEWEEGIAP